jgi:prepilin-type N-terminal cleavage/methylation domain-containing protein
MKNMDGRSTPATENTELISNVSGYSLIELVISVVILGLVVSSFAAVGNHMLAASAENDRVSKAALIATTRMEESVRNGTGSVSAGWISDPPYQWKREVSVLKSDTEGPTLVQVRVTVRDDRGVICSLITHLAK